MVGTLIFGPTSLHGRSHNVGCRNLFPCEQEPLDRSRIEFHEFFFLYLHDRGRRGADDRIPGEMVRRSDAPRERYIERRGYEDRGGIGFSATGVSAGIGNDCY